MMRLSLFAFLCAFTFISVSCSKDKHDLDGDASIVIDATTDESLILKEKSTRAEDPKTYFLTVSGPDGKLKDEEVLGSTTKLSNLTPGSYTVTLTSKKEADFGLPAYNRPIYKGTLTKDVASGTPTPFSITCTQMNVGVKFVFDQSVTDYYTALVGTIADNADLAKKLTLTPANAGTNTAYFEAPSTLRLSFTNNGTPIKIGGSDYATIDVASKELWTITFKTSTRVPGGIDMTVTVDEGTDDKQGDFGLGEVIGAGTLASPYSVSDAINALPAYGVWVEGYVVGTVAATRAAGKSLLLGKSASSPAADCLVVEMPDNSTIAGYLADEDLESRYLGRHIAIQGNVLSKGSFAPDAKAVAMAVTDFNLEYSADYLPYNYKFQNATLKGSATFPVGTAISHEALESDQMYVDLLKREFSSVTSEYTMKMDVIWKSRTVYDFTLPDKIVDFALANGMRVHGHTLIWSQVVPEWVKNLNLENSEEWAELMKEYITKVVTYYAGKVSSWDVVNEAFNNHNGELRGSEPGNTDTFWYDKVGPDFMKIAFQTAREALDAANDTQCKLFYNDYMFAVKDKREGMIRNLQAMLDDDVPIDGIGLQMHQDVRPDYAQVKKAFEEVSALGVLVHASEIDMLINNDTFIAEAKVGDPTNGPWINGDYITSYELYFGTPTVANFSLDYAQGKSYNMVVSAFMQKVPDNQKYGLSTWGFADKYAFMGINNHYGHPEYHLLFNKYYKPKRAYAGVLEGLNGIDWEAREGGGTNWNWRWENKEFEPKAPWE